MAGSLLLTSCSVEEWRAKRLLANEGIKEVSLSSVKEKMQAHDPDTASLMIRSGVASEASEAETTDLLLSAIKKDQSLVLHSLLKKETPFPIKAKHEAMRHAISNNQLGAVKTMLDYDFPRELKMEDGTTPVAWAIKENRLAMSRLLLSNKFSANAEKEATQPLEIAVKDQTPSWMVKHLVSSGADTNFMMQDGKAPILHEIILNRELSALMPLLNGKTDLEQVDADQKTPLFKAVATSEKEKVEQLVLHGADPKRLDERQRNYLQITQIFSDSPEITQYLIDQGLEVNEKNAEGKNSLDLALEYSRFNAARVLLKNNAVTSSDTFTRMYNSGNSAAVAVMIKAALVDPNAALSTGDTILIDSIKEGKVEMVETLLNQGADANLTGVDKEPPLNYATALQDYNCMKLLLDKGADPNTPFQCPSPERFKEIVKTEGRIKWFIDRDPGITPIMMSCDQGNLETTILLRENGADNKGSAKYGFWPGNFAAHLSYTDVVQYMVGAEPGSRERTVLVDLSSQRATVYGKDKKVVMSFRISSGKRGHRTRTGEFVVTNKKRHHISTLYDSAMPYFQRLSYSDFGFHTGVVPGYPASHGCIRCPNSYAYKLYNYLKVGDVVNIQN